MHGKILTALLLAGGACLVTADAAQTASTCDRECLRGYITQVLYAFVKHDVSKLPVADNLRVTENADDKPLKSLDVVRYVTGLHGYRQDYLDERAGIAGAGVMLEESGAPVLLAMRLKIVAGRITEMELVTTSNRAEGLIFNMEHLTAASEGMNYAPRPDEQNTREEIIKAALKYPEGFTKAETFAAVGAPFAPDAYRFENGQLMAGPGCTFFKGCEQIKSQRIPTLAKLVFRIAAVDEEQGVVLIRMDFGPGSVFSAPNGPKDQSLSVFEAFKVYGGQIHAVEAFMKTKPASQPLGWEG